MTMTKNMQMGILGAIGVCGALIVLVQFVVLPMREQLHADREKISELRGKIDEARKVIGTGVEIRLALGQIRGQIAGLARHLPLPVLGNYLLGIQEEIKNCAAGLNVDIAGIAEYDRLGTSLWNGGLKVLRVRVSGQAGLNDLARWFYKLQEKNPFCSISAVSITPQDDNPELHSVSFVVGWLIWGDPQQRPEFLTATNAPAAVVEPIEE